MLALSFNSGIHIRQGVFLEGAVFGNIILQYREGGHPKDTAYFDVRLDGDHRELALKLDVPTGVVHGALAMELLKIYPYDGFCPGNKFMVGFGCPRVSVSRAFYTPDGRLVSMVKKRRKNRYGAP